MSRNAGNSDLEKKLDSLTNRAKNWRGVDSTTSFHVNKSSKYLQAYKIQFHSPLVFEPMLWVGYSSHFYYNLAEQNLKTILGIEFVKSEFALNNFRIDSLALDKEANAFVIIEYKRDKNFSVIDQGYAGQFGGSKGKKFKYKPFKRLLSENRDKSMKEQKELLSNVFESWRGDLEQIDDVVVLGVKI